jgi:hypothetical protein
MFTRDRIAVAVAEPRRDKPEALGIIEQQAIVERVGGKAVR